MHNKNLIIWQIAGGPSSRSFADTFIKYGVGLIGPGYSGPWKENLGNEELEGSFVRRFANEVDIGDVFLLRIGISTICAVGLVASKYVYLSQFDDLNGWDLQHGHRVRWCKLPQAYDFGNPVFGANPTRFSRTWIKEVIDFAERYMNSPPTYWQASPLPELPAEEPFLEEVPSNIQQIVARAHDLVPLYWDRRALGTHPVEDELVAHFVVPFLYSFGWLPEQIAIKWQNIDVAVFKALPRIPENCQYVIEAKRLGSGLEGALGQAKRYVDTLGVLRDVIITDGISYRLYSHERNFVPIAYANLNHLKKSASELFVRLKRS